ncbi:benzoate diol dehydrogenase BenD [Saccharomonospora sp. CUA-673]|uniref:benzoate diol dehydrogenase BenD n=1 Tax=Saccharomonospora sp. CUA-673 TaxID=1904969 RepID=UPI0026F42EAA|nr:benzoate diol dehydrogenase BenD [Saccharomonospora sp. CUA-673]
MGKLAAELPQLTWDHVVADPASTAPNKGYVMSLIGDRHLHDGNVEVYLCGPPPMVDAVRAHFADRGITPAAIHYEKFAVAAAPDDALADDALPDDAPGDGPGNVLPEGAAVKPAEEATMDSADNGVHGVHGVRDALGGARAVHGVDSTEERLRELVGIGIGEGRAVAGQVMFDPGTAAPLGTGHGAVDPVAEQVAVRSVAGQEMFAAPAGPTPTTDRTDAAAGASAASSSETVPEPRRAGERSAPRPAFVSPGRFAGKVVVVTGAAQGIGEHTARRIGAEGGTVVLADRSPLVTEVADDVTGAGGTAEPVLADLETYAGAQAVIDRAVEAFGRIDVLINNVGGAMWFKPFTEFTPEQIQAEITRSLMTTLWSCRAALPALTADGGGTIVNVSSVATRGIHRIPYSAAKGGINAITESLAMECADAGVRVVAAAPGGTDAPPRRIPRGGDVPQTDREKSWFRAHIDQTVASSLLKRYGTLDEQAAVIAFLASDEAAYMTGTVVPVGGGDQG